ncbi:MFS transporter [Agrobacterium tumefaciens]|uniref:MFS transporter n=1 Tax=Agrobacterium tumefaciens TaxID=358 RepID=UPI000471548F
MAGFAFKQDKPNRIPAGEEPFPLAALIALALSGFVTILTEALPAGLLLRIADDLSVSRTAVGQTVTIYAIGSLIAAIPLTRATQRLRRRPLLAMTLAGFAIANLATAFSTSYALTMSARLIAGISAGLLWALLAGYAARMVPDAQKGRAIAVAMAGTPLALSIGVPAATFMGTLVGWRTCFVAMSIVALLLLAWVSIKLPDFPGQASSERVALREVGKISGVRPILFVTLAFVLAHNILYTYIVPMLQPAGMVDSVDVVLFVFGCVSVVGIWLVGLFVDRRLLLLAIVSCSLFIAAMAILGLLPELRSGVYLAVGIWGLAFGGAATIFQTAMARAAPQQTDVAQSMLVTAWNLAIAGGGILGGTMLTQFGSAAFAPAVTALLMACLAVIAIRRNAFQHSF